MVPNAENRRTRHGALRAVALAALVSVTMAGCSSVPDAVNPVNWYEKTTDFFSGDSQAAQTDPASDQDENQGLAADPDAPPPAETSQADDVATAEGGLNADGQAGDYSSPPIERQGAARDVLRDEPESEPAQETAATEPPAPAPAPTQPVSPAPRQPSDEGDTMAAADVPPPPTSSAPQQRAAPQDATPPQGTEALPPRPSSLSMEGAPEPPVLDTRTSSPFGGNDFETVVISGSGMEAQTPSRSLPPARIQASSTRSIPLESMSEEERAKFRQMARDNDVEGIRQLMASRDGGARFPEPGATTTGDVPAPTPAGMTRVATIHFANASADLDARDRSILGAVVQLQRERGGRVVVVGHASSRTSDMDYIRHQMVNFEMSMERAATVGDTLKDLGLSGEKLDIEAVSDARPLYLEVMPSGEAGNRRVEIYLAS